jgi:branched-chain amino acid transport system substrate-binding protein
VISSPEWSVSGQQEFCQAYRQTWGKMPGAVAAYAFDAASLLVEAIRHSWPDRQKLQQAMLDLRYNGVTGPVRFDEKGNRMGRYALMNVRSGCPVPME